jgi:hypothetical protein
MQPHGGKSCPCGCIARFLHLRFLPLKLVHQHKHNAGKKIPFFSPHLIIHPPHCPCIVFHPQRPLPPPPTDYLARLHCRGSGRFGDLRLDTELGKKIGFFLTRDKALRCPERPGAVPGIGCCDGGVASQRVGRPLSPPQNGLHDGAAHGDHGGVG